MKINYIQNQEGVDNLIRLIEDSQLFAIDTEFFREKTYYPILSLIQISINSEIYIIDYLSNLDLSKLFLLLESEDVKKIIHGGRQDLEIFCNQLCLRPKALFDTQIMANLAGYDYNCSYAYLAEVFCKICIDKGQQRSDWIKRPLLQKQLEYAGNDVLYLEQIYQILNSKIRDKIVWHNEEIESLIRDIVADPTPRLFHKLSLKGLNADQKIKAAALIAKREYWARKKNLPRQRIIQDIQIREIIINNSTLGSNLLEEVSSDIDTILNAKKLDNRFILKTTNSKLSSEKDRQCFARANLEMEKIALENNLAKSILLSSQALKRLVINHDLFDQEIYGWRQKLFGKQLKEIILS